MLESSSSSEASTNAHLTTLLQIESPTCSSAQDPLSLVNGSHRCTPRATPMTRERHLTILEDRRDKVRKQAVSLSGRPVKFVGVGSSFLKLNLWWE